MSLSFKEFKVVHKQFLCAAFSQTIRTCWCTSHNKCWCHNKRTGLLYIHLIKNTYHIYVIFIVSALDPGSLITWNKLGQFTKGCLMLLTLVMQFKILYMKLTCYALESLLGNMNNRFISIWSESLSMGAFEVFCEYQIILDISLHWRLNELDGGDQRKYQSSASLAFVRGIHQWLVNSLHKGPVTRKMFPFDDVIISHILVQDPVSV